jgi:colanic acid/amylovoran biosynthesis protein
MRILLDNSGYELKNLGDIAMLQIAISRTRELFPDAELHVFTTQPAGLKRYCPGVIPVTSNGRSLWFQIWNIFGGLHKFVPNNFQIHLRLLEQILRNKYFCFVKPWIVRRFNKRNVNTAEMDTFLSLLDSMDIVVATGGGYITDAFESHATLVLSVIGLAQERNIPTYMFGQGIGPLQSAWLLGLCKQTFPRLKCLALREGRGSLPLLASIGVSTSGCYVTGDDAIELAHRGRPEKLGNALGINMRVASYSDVGVQLLDQVREVLTLSCDKHKAPLVPIPISMYAEESDITTINKLTGAFDSRILDTLDTPAKIIENIRRCRLVITGSYHAGVFALSQGVSVIGLAKSQYYQDKFNGLAAEFKIGCYVIDMRNHDFSQLLEDCIDEAWDAAPENRASLIEQALDQLEKSRQAYKTLQNYKN